MSGKSDSPVIVSGHQPSYLPWLGFFHKLSLCDKYVFMDTVQFEDNGWLHRNKIRIPDGWIWLTIPIDHERSNKDRLDEVYPKGADTPREQTFWQDEHWKSIQHSYASADYFDEYAPPLKKLYKETVWDRLIDLCWAQLELFSEWLGLDDRSLYRMSEHDFEGTKDDLILDQVEKLDGDAVVFGTNGRDYVDVSKFTERGISVYFQDYQHPTYSQRFDGFEPHMSIIDLVFNHGPEARDILLEGNITRQDLRTGNNWVNRE